MKYTISGQCPNVDINITRQGQVDSFKILYPACTNIIRSLNLELTNINNIDSLIVLNGKQNIINIFFNTNLPLNGLNNIDSIKFLGISNPLEITGLKKLKYVGQLGLFDIKILDLSQLKSIDRIDFLNISASDIGENVVSDLIRLPNLNYVGLLVLNGNLLLDGIANIDTIEKIVIQSNKVLSKLSQIKTLKNIQSLTHLTLSGINTYLNLEGLEEVNELKELTFRNIKQVNSLEPLRNISKIETFRLEAINNFGPFDLSELTSIEEINNFF